jgi:hypothetical protein
MATGRSSHHRPAKHRQQIARRTHPRSLAGRLGHLGARKRARDRASSRSRRQASIARRPRPSPEEPPSGARIGELVGHADLVTTARTYTHVLVSEDELDFDRLLAS